MRFCGSRQRHANEGGKVKKLVYSIPTIYESHSLKLNQLKKHDVDLAHTRSAELLPHIDFIIPQTAQNFNLQNDQTV